MIVEERVYTMVPGGVSRYVKLWHEFGSEAQIDCLGEPIGMYTCDIGDINALTYLWQYDSTEDRMVRRNRLQHDERFAAFRVEVRGLVVKQRNRILIPVLSLPLRPREREDA
ncbi:hypothetical protein ABIA30_004806 [Mycobacterium sp. MAA66]|uniref:NIPSNAP family protein n=1 Tax=Mycobacterium sp. MAA66 TaxID=3156297 RepID=UPI0035130A2E